MGYASTYEAISEKLVDLAHLAEEAAREAPQSSMPRECAIELSRLLAQARDTMSQLSMWLELATNPELELGRQLHEARDAQREMEARIASYERTCLLLMSSLARERSATEALRQELSAAVLAKNKVDRTLEARAKENPAKVYDAYPPKQRDVRRKGS